MNLSVLTPHIRTSLNKHRDSARISLKTGISILFDLHIEDMIRIGKSLRHAQHSSQCVKIGRDMPRLFLRKP